MPIISGHRWPSAAIRGHRRRTLVGEPTTAPWESPEAKRRDQIRSVIKLQRRAFPLRLCKYPHMWSSFPGTQGHSVPIGGHQPSEASRRGRGFVIVALPPHKTAREIGLRSSSGKAGGMAPYWARPWGRARGAECPLRRHRGHGHVEGAERACAWRASASAGAATGTLSYLDVARIAAEVNFGE